MKMKAILLFIAASGHAFNIASTLRLRGKWEDLDLENELTSIRNTLVRNNSSLKEALRLVSPEDRALKFVTEVAPLGNDA